MVSTELNTFSTFLVPEYYFGRAILVITFHSTGARLYLETSTGKTDFRLWPLQMTIPLFLLLQTSQKGIKRLDQNMKKQAIVMIFTNIMALACILE